MESERRKYIRHPLSYPLKTKILHPAKEGKEVQSEADNISAGGLLFTCDQEIQIGCEVEIELTIEKRIFLLDGRIVRCEKKDNEKEFSIAVVFNSPNEFLKARMMEQAVRIEEFKNRLERRYKVKLDFGWAAKEWIKRYSGIFARHYDI